MVYRFKQKVLFKHCDPAGIVFYPRYFEMINDCVEAFFFDVVKMPFETMHETGGVPTAEISTRFLAPSRHGDLLELTLRVDRVGRTSLGYTLNADCKDERRFETRAVLVHVDSNGRPDPWPQTAHDTLIQYKDTPQ